MSTFKFYPPQTRQFLENLGVRFTQPSDLNDPSELLPVYCHSDVTEYIRRLKLSEVFPGKGKHEEEFITFLNAQPGLLKKVVMTAHREELEKMGILSLSKTCESPQMWAYYCQNYSGYVVEFDRSHPFFSEDKGDPPLLSKISDVLYTSERQFVRLGDSAIDPRTWLTKDPQWKHEKEERLIRLRSGSDGTFDGGRVSIWFVPKEAVISIIVGHRADSTLKAQVEGFRARFPHVQLFGTEFDTDANRVRPIPF